MNVFSNCIKQYETHVFLNYILPSKLIDDDLWFESYVFLYLSYFQKYSSSYLHTTYTQEGHFSSIREQNGKERHFC